MAGGARGAEGGDREGCGSAGAGGSAPSSGRRWQPGQETSSRDEGREEGKDSLLVVVTESQQRDHTLSLFWASVLGDYTFSYILSFEVVVSLLERLFVPH